MIVGRINIPVLASTLFAVLLLLTLAFYLLPPIHHPLLILLSIPTLSTPAIHMFVQPEYNLLFI